MFGITNYRIYRRHKDDDLQYIHPKDGDVEFCRQSHPNSPGKRFGSSGLISVLSANLHARLGCGWDVAADKMATTTVGWDVDGVRLGCGWKSDVMVLVSSCQQMSV